MPTVSNKNSTPQAVEHAQAASDTDAKSATGKRYKLTLQGLVHQRHPGQDGTGHPNSWRKSSFPAFCISLFLPQCSKVTTVQECPSKQDISPTHEIREQTFINQQTPPEISSPSAVS